LIIDDETMDASFDEVGDKASMVHVKMGDDSPGYSAELKVDAFHSTLIFEKRAGPASIDGEYFIIDRALDKEAVCVSISEVFHILNKSLRAKRVQLTLI